MVLKGKNTHLMKKNTMDNILQKFINDFRTGFFVRVGSKEHDLFIGKDDEGRYCFEYRGNFTPVKLVGSEFLAINQYKDTNSTKILRISLAKDEVIGCFIAFCEDLTASVEGIVDDNVVYKTLIARFQSWRKLFKSDNSVLTENEIIGLMAELLFLKDWAIPHWGIDEALSSWTGPECTHKDFSKGNEWFEIKAISNGKETVRISSIEQLDSEDEGYLSVYSFEKMSPSFDGVNLNALVQEFMDILNTVQKDCLLEKLSTIGFNFSPAYDGYVYDIKDQSFYKVTEDFPRIRRASIPLSISKVAYDLILSEIQCFKVNLA